MMIWTRIIHRPLLPLIGVGLLLGLLNWAVQGPVPGDIALTRSLQAMFGHQPGWANIVTKGATGPWIWLIAGLVSLLLYVLHSARIALVVPLSVALAIAMDGLLRFYIYSPRPLAALVAVAKPSASSGLPSTYGLMTGATIGLLAMVALADGRVAVRGIGAIALFWLVTGWAARVTMGGHWTSQLLASYAVSVMLAHAMVMLLRRG